MEYVTPHGYSVKNLEENLRKHYFHKYIDIIVRIFNTNKQLSNESKELTNIYIVR